MACPGSVAPGGTASFYAAEGTFAHDIAAKCLLDANVSPMDFLLQKKVIDGHEVECNMDMVESVGVYLDAVRDDQQDGDEWWVEMPLLKALQNVDPDMGGTADFVRYRPSTRHLRVMDYKHGAGVFVEVEGNIQARVYALGVLLELLARNRLVDTVQVAICQPRFEGAKPVREWEFKAFDLLEFAADLKDAAARTRNDWALRVAGKHCGFCPNAKDCPELAKYQRQLLALDMPVADVTGAAEVFPAALAEALPLIPLVKARIKAIEEFAYLEACRGVEIPGMKLVDKRPTRRFIRDADVIEWAQANTIDPFVPRELKSPAQLEAVLKDAAPRGKKKDATKVLEPFIEKVSSGTALVPISDERPAVKKLSADDFAANDGTAETKQQPPVNLFA